MAEPFSWEENRRPKTETKSVASNSEKYVKNKIQGQHAFKRLFSSHLIIIFENKLFLFKLLLDYPKIFFLSCDNL